MRIISGQYKGRIIKMPKGIRPTQDKVRKALFDILADIEGLSFLEFFAGSGAVGLEAISQGAGGVVFVENNLRCIKALKDNLTHIPHTAYYILNLDVCQAVKKLAKDGKKFDIIFLDPPYYQGMAKKTLQTLSACDILAPNGFVVAQHFKKDALPGNIDGLTMFKRAGYGDTVLSFYKKNVPTRNIPG